MLPGCRITMTLHEYLAICHHYGQMVTKPALTLCYGAAPRKCVKCFPEKAPEDFFLRKRYVERFFDLVDDFVSPSEFLAGRYREWGIEASRIRVRENVVTVGQLPKLLEKSVRSPNAPMRVGFFGQISKLKGIGVILEAAEILTERQDYKFVFEIYGSDDGQPAEFQVDFRERIHRAGKNVIHFGPYAREHVSTLMSAVDVVVVPSIWWENSPLVIQEAHQIGKIVISSNIGGMLEKNSTKSGGTLFSTSNPLDLIAKLTELREECLGGFGGDR
jgi:glycosyltransferase involved in cell wall biosynthesis